MNQDHSDSESESDNDISDKIEISDGLSSSTLSALLEFMNPPSLDLHLEDTLDSLPAPPSYSGQISTKSVVAAYTPNDVNVIAETFARLQARADAEEIENPKDDNEVAIAIEDRVLLVLEATPLEACVTTLLQEGVVRLNGVLSSDTCDACRSFILDELQIKIDAEDDMTVETGFGNVLTREHRWDLYLHNEGVCATALQECFSSQSSKLSQLFGELFQGKNASFHEFSALISDNHAKSQPIHPDSWFQHACPLYTVFIALQDITASMGPTLFLPCTHNQHDHAQHKSKHQSIKNKFLAKCIYKQGLLSKGDVVVMDSRTMHCGTANSSGKRVLLYFTLNNPHFAETPPPKGSKFADLELFVESLRQ